jgi:hypothetical protein
MRHAGSFGLALALMMGVSTFVHAQEVKEEYATFEEKELLSGPAEGVVNYSGPVTVLGGGGGPLPAVTTSFQGLTQYDTAAFARNFIPPDTMGAAGKTQLMEFVNGAVAVYDKSTGATLSKVSDVAFWAAAGKTGVNGDSRVMYDAAADRWIALAFGASVSNIQIAVSDTSNALGPWKSTIFTGFAGGTADYPTLALDNNNAYIGTNNFNAAGSFRGTSLDIIPLSSLLAAGGPTIAGAAVINTPYSPTTGGADGGFAIQGVNSNDGNTGHVIAASLFFDDVIRYDINGADNLATAVKTTTTYIGTADYGSNGAARQPNAVPDVQPPNPTNLQTFPSNDRVIDTLDQRIGSSAYEVNGRIYAVYTVTPVGGDHTYIRYDIVDAATNAILSEGMIGDGVHDYWEGSLAVNSEGRLVIAYNRSGSDASDGNVSFLARVFTTNADGGISQRGDELLLKVSVVDDYHNGSLDGQVALGRQRWGDYSAVSLDPTNSDLFWVFGEYAMEYNDAAGGHPGGTGGSRYGTWISGIDGGTEVPEPSVWAMLIAGFGLTGAALRRRQRLALKLA